MMTLKKDYEKFVMGIGLLCIELQKEIKELTINYREITGDYYVPELCRLNGEEAGVVVETETIGRIRRKLIDLLSIVGK